MSIDGQLLPEPGRTSAFFTDVTTCIGCKACEVACKEWNLIPATNEINMRWRGRSYDHGQGLGHSSYRHVKFVEQNQPLGGQLTDPEHPFRWVFLSDVCKHCEHAGCMELCPTGAIVRTEFNTVFVQPDVCNGCGYCVVGCPFGVIDRRPDDGRAFKCTFCYDRQVVGEIPACAKACPTDAIRFGPYDVLREQADRRVELLHARGVPEARLETGEGTSVGHTNAFSLLVDRPEPFGLPPNPIVPSMHLKVAWTSALLTAAALGIVLLGAFAVG